MSFLIALKSRLDCCLNVGSKMVILCYSGTHCAVLAPRNYGVVFSIDSCNPIVSHFKACAQVSHIPSFFSSLLSLINSFSNIMYFFYYLSPASFLLEGNLNLSWNPSRSCQGTIWGNIWCMTSTSLNRSAPKITLQSLKSFRTLSFVEKKLYLMFFLTKFHSNKYLLFLISSFWLNAPHGWTKV